MAVDFVLKLDGIKGESKLDKHTDEIDIESFSFGATNPTSMHRGGGGGAGKVSVSDMSFTKLVDSATPNLFKYCANGTHIASGKFVLRKSGTNPLDYLVFELTDVMVSSWQDGGTNGTDQVVENFSLSFAKVKITYTPQKQDGSPGSAIPAGWDIVAGKAA